ncbi:hypothetical protein [Paenibacillus tyrfis]|nr:hypothetical protein [Paenibacillus tyrfis]
MSLEELLGKQAERNITNAADLYWFLRGSRWSKSTSGCWSSTV